VEQQPSGRFERIDGIVVAMAPERAATTAARARRAMHCGGRRQSRAHLLRGFHRRHDHSD
jgi:hypothetical protein